MDSTPQSLLTAEESALFGPRLVTWERKTQWVLATLALVFLALYAYEVIGRLSGPTLAWVENSITIIWLVFFIDYVIRISITRNRWQWIKANIVDLLSVALPVLRPLRLLRVVALIRILHRTTGERIRDKIITYTVCSTILLVIVSSLAILEAERDVPNASITSFPDALWWSVVTITTVGYGDYTPVSPTGRLITLALMIGGMALIGVITATLASWITERSSDENERIEETTQRQIMQLEKTIAALHQEITVLRENVEKSIHSETTQEPSPHDGP